MNRMTIIAATVCVLVTPVSAKDFNLTDTHLAITLPDDCTLDANSQMNCKDQDGLYLTQHFHMEPGKTAKEQIKNRTF